MPKRSSRRASTRKKLRKATFSRSLVTTTNSAPLDLVVDLSKRIAELDRKVDVAIARGRSFPHQAEDWTSPGFIDTGLSYSAKKDLFDFRGCEST